MAEHIARKIVREIRDLTGCLHVQPELDARDRHSIFTINDLLSNLSFEREAQRAALDAMLAEDIEGHLDQMDRITAKERD